jgi:Zn-dependent peptidase ImmA (M78 family)
LDKIRANQIVAKAFQTRKKYSSTGINTPICPFNLAESMGFDVRFLKISSFEGMYLADEGMILISSDRPEGRKRFTCAHELGHHVLGHGTVIDEIIEFGSNKEIEKEADFFSAMLLMPSSAVRRAAKDIGINFNSVSTSQIYILSKYLGVSYAALLTQLYFNLKLVGSSIYKQLKSPSLRDIKNNFSHGCNDCEVFVVGSWWRDHAVDIVTGDLIILDSCCVLEGAALSNYSGNNTFLATAPGIVKLSNEEGWSVFVRVSRKNYSGMFQYRHEGEVE